jgi:hypothetical protein
MDASRKADRKADEITLQYQSQHDLLLVDELNEDKLKQLLAFIGHLEKTPPGAADLQRRIKLFGECKRGEDETSGHFCARLRHWLDRNLPNTKSPRHAPRQVSD